MPKTVLMCPSITASDDLMRIAAEPCIGSRCTLNVGGRCTAGKDTSDVFRRHFSEKIPVPDCPLAARCVWNLESVRLGDRACAPRMLGLVCEHQRDESNQDVSIWNTFDMESPDNEDAWKVD